MPDLNKLYEGYKDRGLLILGVYGSDKSSTDQEISDTIQKTGTTYPNLLYCQEFSVWLDDLLPVTVFLDENGKGVGEPIIGSRSYEEWKYGKLPCEQSSEKRADSFIPKSQQNSGNGPGRTDVLAEKRREGIKHGQHNHQDQNRVLEEAQKRISLE